MTNERAWDAGIEVARLTGAGLPLAAGLRAYAAEAGSRHVRRAVDQVCAKLEAGVPLDEALRSQESLFPAHIRALIAAAAETGQLEDTLSHLLTVRTATQSLRRSAWLGLAYPVALIVMALAVVVFIQLFIASSTAEIVTSFDMELPVFSEIFLSLFGHGVWPLLVVLGAALVILAAFRLLLGRARWRWLFDRVPFVGPMWRFASLSEIARLIALLVDRQVPLPRSLALAADATDDADLARGCRQLAADVTAGRSLSEAFRRQRRFPATLEPLAEWGEANASLPDALETAAEIFSGRAQGQLGLIRLVVPPILFLFVALAIVGAFAASFLPLIKLITTLA
jgi:type II secretory pathway component PulF